MKRRDDSETHHPGSRVGWKATWLRGTVEAADDGAFNILWQVRVRWDDGHVGWFNVEDCPEAALEGLL